MELGLRVGKNVTTDDDLAYTILTPSLGVVYRIGSNKTEFGTQDLAAKVSYEIRKYPDPSGGTAGSPTAEAEKQKNLAFNATYDFWLAPWLSLGAYLSYSKRDSNDDSADYNRTQVGGRLTATW